MHKRLFFIYLLILPIKPVFSDAIGFEIITLTSHVSHYTIQLGKQYHRKLLSDGRHVLTPGIEVYYDKQSDTNLASINSLRFVVAGYYDSMNHFSGYFALTPRWILFKQKKMSLNLGLGPSLIFRESWNSIPDYQDDGYYHESKVFSSNYQYKLILGGDINIHYRLNRETEFVWSIIPGLPYIVTHAFGLRWTR